MQTTILFGSVDWHVAHVPRQSECVRIEQNPPPLQPCQRSVSAGQGSMDHSQGGGSIAERLEPEGEGEWGAIVTSVVGVRDGRWTLWIMCFALAMPV